MISHSASLTVVYNYMVMILLYIRHSIPLIQEALQLEFNVFQISGLSRDYIQLILHCNMHYDNLIKFMYVFKWSGGACKCLVCLRGSVDCGLRSSAQLSREVSFCCFFFLCNLHCMKSGIFVSKRHCRLSWKFMFTTAHGNLQATPKTAVNCRKLTRALLGSCPPMTPLPLILGEALTCKWKCCELYKCKSG